MTNSVSDGADFWNKRFDTPEYIFGKNVNEYLKEQADRHLTRGDTVLCVADGEGRNSVWLAKQGMHVDAFDVSNLAAAKAKQLALDLGVQVNYVLASTDDWHWQPNQYDAVAAIFIQFADPDMRARLFAQMIFSIKPGGLLILQGYTPEQLVYKTGGPSILEHLYTEALIRELVASEMDIVDLRVYEKVLREGAKHTGMSALLGLVAKKR